MQEQWISAVADQIIQLINSRPQSPRKNELEAIIAEGILQGRSLTEVPSGWVVVGRAGSVTVDQP